MSSISQQKIHSLYIKELKCLKDVDISFEDKAVTAILGPNGHGKSTILHALACCYQPIDENITENKRFSDFFLPNTDAQWQGSELTLTHSYRKEQEAFNNGTTIYEKKADRWKPIYARRPERHVYYLGIDKFIPIIESEKQTTIIKYETTTLSGDLTDTIKKKASDIFNKQYTAYNNHKYLSGIIERLDYDKSVGYTKIVDLVSAHCQDQWRCYISEVHTWLKEKVPEVRESDYTRII